MSQIVTNQNCMKLPSDALLQVPSSMIWSCNIWKVTPKLQPRTLKIWQSAKQIVDVLQYLYLLLRLTAGRGSEADQLKLVASCIILSSFNQGNILTWHKHKYNGISEYRYDWCWNVGCLLLVTGQSWTQAAFITLYKQIRLDFHSQLSWIPSNFLLRTKQRNLQTITPSLVAGQAKLDVLLSSFPSF